MKTIDILESALDKLENMTPEEVQELSKQKGIKLIEKKSTDNNFIIDLQGLFPEAINGK